MSVTAQGKEEAAAFLPIWKCKMEMKLLINRSKTILSLPIPFKLSFSQLCLLFLKHFLSLCATFGVLWEAVSEATVDECTYVYKTNIQLFGGVSPLEVASGIHVIVPDDPCDDIWRWDALSSLRWYEHPWAKWEKKASWESTAGPGTVAGSWEWIQKRLTIVKTFAILAILFLVYFISLTCELREGTRLLHGSFSLSLQKG